jgi:type IV secretion system protein VirD4
MRNTAASDFKIADLVHYEKPVSLYIVVPPSDSHRLAPLLRVVFTLIANRLTDRMDFDDHGMRRPNKHRLLLLIDEFPTLGKMEVFSSALSYMGGYGIKAYLIAQDIRQIVKHYGVHESIVSNCHVRIAFAPNQLETAEILSKMTGLVTIEKANFSFSGNRGAPVLDHVNASVEQIQRPLMTADEILRLRGPKKEGTAAAERIVAPGDMLIFVSGQPPIFGTQMLYFADPVFRDASQETAPTTVPMIQDGQVREQLPLALAGHRRSKPETEIPEYLPRVATLRRVIDHSELVETDS